MSLKKTPLLFSVLTDDYLKTIAAHNRVRIFQIVSSTALWNSDLDGGAKVTIEEMGIFDDDGTWVRTTGYRVAPSSGYYISYSVTFGPTSRWTLGGAQESYEKCISDMFMRGFAGSSEVSITRVVEASGSVTIFIAM